MMRLFALLLLFFAGNAAAQYSGPAVDACLAYAGSAAHQSGNSNVKVEFNRDRHLLIERYTRKVGSQFVSSLLSGHGAMILNGATVVEMSFLCLLANDKTAVFFDWRPRPDAPVLAQCRRAPGAEQCLQTLLQAAEYDLSLLNADQLGAARDADRKAGNENATGSFRQADDLWRQYRDAECARRGAASSEPWRACVVEITRRRALDLR
jgi:hypothetical protein